MQSVHLWGNIQGRIQDFQLGGAHLKKLRRVEGGAKNFGVFRVKNHDFTPKNLIFSNFRGGDPPPPWTRPWYYRIYYFISELSFFNKCWKTRIVFVLFTSEFWLSSYKQLIITGRDEERCLWLIIKQPHWHYWA